MSLACEICYEFYSDYPPERLPHVLPRCGHDFCARCIRSLCLTEKHPCCPKCRLCIYESNEGDTYIYQENNDYVQSTINTDDGGKTVNYKKKEDKTIFLHRFPLVRCILQLEERLDFSSTTTPLLLFHRALEAAPTELLQMQLDQRRTAELLDYIPLETLKQAVDKRNNKQDEPLLKTNEIISDTATNPPPPSSPCQRHLRHRVVCPCYQQQTCHDKNMMNGHCANNNRSQFSSQIYTIPSTCRSMYNNNHISNIGCVCQQQQYRPTSPIIASIPATLLKWVTTTTTSTQAYPYHHCINNNQSSSIHCPTIQHSTTTIPSLFSSSHFCNNNNICYCHLASSSSTNIYNNYQNQFPNRCFNNSFHYFSQTIFECSRYLFTLLWSFIWTTLQCLPKAITSFSTLFQGIQREQLIQIVMIANAIPLLVGSLYVFLNPTIFVRVLSHTG